MKRLLSIFLVFAMLVITSATLASCQDPNGEDDDGNSTVYSEGLHFTSNGDGTCSVTKLGVCTDEKVIIPPVSPNGDKVVSIAAKAFENEVRRSFEIVIPEGVESIEKFAFSGASLCGVELPRSLTKIDRFAFYATSKP